VAGQVVGLPTVARLTRPYRNPHVNPLDVGGYVGCSPMFTKRLDLRELVTHTIVRTTDFRLGVK
jgi:hypothetical protein